MANSLSMRKVTVLAAVFPAVWVLFVTTAICAQEMTNKAMPEKVADNRQIIRLTEAEQAIVAADMRQMLASVQGVFGDLAREDMQAVIDAASKSGMQRVNSEPRKCKQ